MFKKEKTAWVKHLDFMIIDILCLELSFILATLIRNGGIDLSISRNNPYMRLFLILILAEFVIFYFFEPFIEILKRDAYTELKRVARQTLALFVIMTLYLFLTKDGEGLSRIVFVLTVVFYFILNYTSRYLLKRYLKKRRAAKDGKNALLLIASRTNAAEALRNLKENNYEKFLIRGIALIDCAGKETGNRKIGGVAVVAGRDNIISYLGNQWIDEVMVDLPKGCELDAFLMEGIMKMGVVLHRKIANDRNEIGRKRTVGYIGDNVILTTSMNVISPAQLIFKRAVDITAGVFGCIICALVLLIFGPMIYRKSPGPIIFTQTRVGRNGKKFKLYKLRSMYMDAEERKKDLLARNQMEGNLIFKLENDPRIIGSEEGCGKGIGNFIRKYSLDEWPQFFNVLKGDMSLIGTRPPTVDEWRHYDVHHRARLAFKPGITGMWQVNGRSRIKNFEEIVRLDRYYINEWNILLDVKIFFKTFAVLLGRDGAM